MTVCWRISAYSFIAIFCGELKNVYFDCFLLILIFEYIQTFLTLTFYFSILNYLDFKVVNKSLMCFYYAHVIDIIHILRFSL